MKNKIRIILFALLVSLAFPFSSLAQTEPDQCKPSISGISNMGYESRMKLRAAKKIEVPETCKMEILSYDITFTTFEGKVVTKKKTGNAFDATFPDLVNKAGKEMYIENIKAKVLETGEIKKLHSIIIKFKD